ncbi:ankyrin repeat-containing domain protein, partial [Gaertneriomyces semiglobifer]
NIWVAASDGRVDLVEHFLQFGGSDGNSMDVNSKDDSGYTPLHAAAAYAHLDLIRLLVEKYKADVNITDDDGDTPLHVCETVAAAKLLVELGADPKRANEEGQL